MSARARRPSAGDHDPMRNGTWLYWIPLGAGGTGFVAMNGRIYEAAVSRLAGREPLAIYHTALEVRSASDRFIVETMWPSPKGDPTERGVTMTAPVFARWLSFTRIFRYEVRCWTDGVLPDADQAVGGPRLISEDHALARRLLELTHHVPPLIWGRDQSGTGDMWNSNSVVSWLLVRAGASMNEIDPPPGGRAPGWDAGLAIAAMDRPGDS